MGDNNEWKVPSVFTEICELRKECHDLHNDNTNLQHRNDCQAQQLSSLRDDLAQAWRDRDEALDMAEDRQHRLDSAGKDLVTALDARDHFKALAEDRQRRMENAEKEVERLIGIARARAQRITNLENAIKRPGDEDPFSDKALAPAQQYLNVQLLEGTTKGVNGLHAVGQVIGHLQLSRKDTRNIGHWLINSVREELE